MAYYHLSSNLSRPKEGFYCSEVQDARRQPIRTFLPTGYEPNYPYPLLVLFHGHGGSEERVLRLAPRLSRRNYISISLRGPEVLGVRPDGRMAYSWGVDGEFESQIEDYVFRAVEQTRRNYHVHSERIYLAGLAEGATPVYRLGLNFPERFAGIISLNGARSRLKGPLLRWHAVRGLSVFIGHGNVNTRVPLALARNDFRVFYAAGMPVRMHSYPTNHRFHPHMLRDVNRWIMEHTTAQ